MKVPTSHTIELREVCAGDPAAEEIRGISLGLNAGCVHLLRGADGSGNTLLWRLLGLLERPSAGEVWVRDAATAALSDEARAEIRAQRFGFVFAAPFLLSSFSVIENVAMPLFKISQVTPEEARRRTEKMLEFVGLGESVEWPVDELPLLAQYRVAVARGLINDPGILLVEHLDGNLAGDELVAFGELLTRVAEAGNVAVVATAKPETKLHGRWRAIDLEGGAVIADAEFFPENLS